MFICEVQNLENIEYIVHISTAFFPHYRQFPVSFVSTIFWLRTGHCSEHINNCDYFL